MTQYNAVIMVVGPAANPDTVAKELLSDTVYADGLGQGVFPLPEDLKRIDECCIYVCINPNSVTLNDILNNPNTEVVVQTHTIGEISRISGDMFTRDCSEADIGDFTRLQHQYKRTVASITKLPNVTLVETPIGTKESIITVWDKAKELLIEASPVPEAPVVEEKLPPSLDFDNRLGSEEEEVAVVQPVAVEETQPVKDEEDFDPLATLVEKPKVEIEQPVPEPIQAEEPKVEEKPEPVVEVPEVSDFEKALFDSLAQAESAVNPSTTKDVKAASKKAFGIPEVYPDVDQTVTFDINKIFKDSIANDSSAGQTLHDFGGNIKTFQRVHSLLGAKLAQAVNNNIDSDLTDFEASVYRYGQDQVSTSEAHRMQYVEGARWANMIKAGPAAIPIIMPIRDPNYGDAKYVGPESVTLLQNRMKTGCKIGVWLPHSGIYFIIISPSDSQFIDTLAVINNQRIETLRTSSGILLGNSNYYINRQVIKLFIDSIVHCSLKAWNREQLMNLINERDINIVACALGSSIYPDGYEYVQVCGLTKEDKSICQHQTKKLVDLRRLVFVDNSRLTEAQRIFASGALTERSVAEVENYQAANYIGFKKPYEITPGVQFVYRSQSALSSIEAGEKWIKEIEQVVDNIITFREDEDSRNLMIEERINLTRIREYSQWVEEILVDEQPLTDRTKINALLNTLSRNKDVVEKVSSTLTEFQRLASVAIVAIPRCECVECRATETKDLDIATHLIPQDAVSRLFTLVRQL